MKKSLTNILARMAKDGDIETVAEILEAVAGAEKPTVEPAEEIIAPVTAVPVVAAPVAPPTAPVAAPVVAPVVAAPAPVVAPAATEAIADPAAVIETPEGTTITVDSDTVAEILSRLDKLVELIGGLVNPEHAADVDPADVVTTEQPAVEPDVVEEIAETVEEAMEAVGAVQAAQNAEEAASVIVDPAQEGVSPEEISEMVSALMGEEEQEEDPAGDCNSGRTSGDALRTALKPFRGKLSQMSPKRRRKVCADLAAIMQRKNNAANDAASIYAAIRQAVQPQKAPDPRELGRKIMAARNVNYRNKKDLI